MGAMGTGSPAVTEVRLRQFGLTDFQRLIGWIDSNESLVVWAGPAQFRFPLSMDQLQAYCAESGGGTPRKRIFAATDEQCEVCGHIELGAIDAINQTATLCRVMVSPERRGKGLCVPMVRAALRIGFEEMGLRRVELRVYAHNLSAIRCYEAAGFVKEGYLRKAQKVGDALWDTVVMGILRDEWADVIPRDRGKSGICGDPPPHLC